MNIKRYILLFLKVHLMRCSKEEEHTAHVQTSAIVYTFPWFSVENRHADLFSQAITCGDTGLTLK